MKRNKIFIKPAFVILAFALLIIINLIIGLNNYHLRSVSLNRFLLMQSLHHYESSGKLTITQIYRENIVENKETNLLSCDTCPKKGNYLKKITSVKQGIHYIRTSIHE